MGKLAEIKTKETEASAEEFIKSVKDEQMRQDSFTILKLMQKVSKEKPKMWGSSLIGFGVKRYKSPATGREVDWFKIGFSPRKGKISLHLVFNMQEQSEALNKLGKHKTGAGCLYIKTLNDIDVKVLEELIRAALKGK
jgi:hypothetical protein